MKFKFFFTDYYLKIYTEKPIKDFLEFNNITVIYSQKLITGKYETEVKLPRFGADKVIEKIEDLLEANNG